jgi:hypothetical protein
MSDLMTKYQEQLDQAIALAEKIDKQKSYLIDLLIKDVSPQSTMIINKYLDWLEENESK